MIFDSHTHLYWRSFDKDREETIQRARDAGVQRMLVIGTDVPSSEAALELAHRDPDMWAAVGIHPNDLGETGPEPQTLARIVELANDERCVAIGETGLDYYWDRVSPAVQKRGFRWHLELSAATQKPVVIHSRDAHADTLQLLTEARAEIDANSTPGGVMHCFTMGPEEARAYVALDLYVSFSGVLTYPKNEANREAARLVPQERLLVETDSPFLPPQPWRGKRNEPAHVTAVVDQLAKLRDLTPQDLATLTAHNAARLFRLPH